VAVFSVLGFERGHADFELDLDGGYFLGRVDVVPAGPKPVPHAGGRLSQFERDIIGNGQGLGQPGVFDSLENNLFDVVALVVNVVLIFLGIEPGGAVIVARTVGGDHVVGQ